MRYILLALLGLLVLGCTTPQSPATVEPEEELPPPPPVEEPSPPTVAPLPVSEKTITRIARGTSFGQCSGYCITGMVITGDSVVYREIGIPDPEARQIIPERNVTFKLEENEWEELVALVDLDAWESLPETIGCPDCADEGAEVVEVDYDSTRKSARFSYGQDPPGLERLLERLREIQETALERMQESVDPVFEVFN